MGAAVVKALGWNANWSEKLRSGGGNWEDGYMTSQTKISSVIRERISVMEMDLYFAAWG